MKKTNNLLPFDVICEAASGDTIAIEKVINITADILRNYPCGRFMMIMASSIIS